MNLTIVEKVTTFKKVGNQKVLGKARSEYQMENGEVSPAVSVETWSITRIRK